MKYCPITYEAIRDDEHYSTRGLRMLSPQLKNLQPLAFSAAEQRMEAIARAGKMSIQGVQPKLSAQLKIQEQRFNIVDYQGNYILKIQSENYPELPENEALTMTLASMIGIDVPLHGLIYAKDNSMTYFIKRFDRYGHHKKLPVEDFGQLCHLDRDTKYESSMERVIKTIAEYCTFPKIELGKLFKLTLFNFLVGNEDMHVKNFSLITQTNNIITLSPAYDLLNSTIALKNAAEEIALPLNGKKNNLTKRDLLRWFGAEKMGLHTKFIGETVEEIQQALPEWEKLIERSFLSKTMREKYHDLIEKRFQRLK